ncbi:hypothetical protein FA13DRAFT_1716755 [Coprinellus micaceus]|uniref:Uncharacterized protein n=1 Tax=Coprinellus micaceus TaxID=71717 RepID=A0A4Y7SJ20_COPMI|nr:hypothetical protein FA13DRAFT_1716755 [Coprinellus micaceus]
MPQLVGCAPQAKSHLPADALLHHHPPVLLILFKELRLCAQAIVIVSKQPPRNFARSWGEVWDYELECRFGASGSSCRGGESRALGMIRQKRRILRHAALVDGYPLNGLNPQQGIERLIGPSNAQVVGALQSLALEYVSIYRWKPTPFMAELFLDLLDLAGRRGEEARSRYSHWLDIFLEDLGTRGLPIPLSPLALGLLAKDGSRSLVGAQQQRRGGWQSLIYGSMPESVENGRKKKREKQFQERKRGEGGGGGKGFDGA